jgi:hypothetical protein
MPRKQARAIGTIIRAIEDEILHEFPRVQLPEDVLECLSALDTLLEANGFRKIFERYRNWPWWY